MKSNKLCLYLHINSEMKHPHFYFSICVIKICEQVTFALTGIVVKFATDDSIGYEDRIYKLSPFVGTLCQKSIETLRVPTKVPSISHITRKCWMR